MRYEKDEEEEEEEYEEEGWIVKCPPNPFSLMTSNTLALKDRERAAHVVRDLVESLLPRDLASIVAEYAPCLRQFLVSIRRPEIFKAIKTHSPFAPWIRTKLLECAGTFPALARVGVRRQNASPLWSWHDASARVPKTLVAIAFADREQEQEQDQDLDDLSVRQWTLDDKGTVEAYEGFDYLYRRASSSSNSSIAKGQEIRFGEPLLCFDDLMFFGSIF